jgi:hypothetical protein
MEQCDNCHYWSGDQTCQRYPPAVVTRLSWPYVDYEKNQEMKEQLESGEISWVEILDLIMPHSEWPETEPTDWCGEWKAK